MTRFPGAPRGSLPPGAYIEEGVVVYNDQGYTPQEWARRGDRPHRVGITPLTSEQRRAYNRDWMRNHREMLRREAIANGQMIRAVASLHDFACTGPTRATGCRCRKVTLYERVERAA